MIFELMLLAPTPPVTPYVAESRCPPLPVGMSTTRPIYCNAPMRRLDVQRYMGDWYELARLPQRFQQDCIANVTARYQLEANGRISVRNGCDTKAGRISAMGEAKRTDIAGALKVRFAPKWLSWLPAVWADYWVIDLDPNYQWAVVGGASKDYLWLLSRSPTMDRQTFNAILQYARWRGYAVDKMIISAGVTP